jgi:mannose-1-phosphate guanylyltransferase / phosphomannomutase
MIRQCVILAGGLGTRLSAINNGAPKALTKILGEPIIEIQIRKLAEVGINEIVLLLGHKATQIENYLGDGTAYGVSLRYVIEDDPLGTGGALLNALPYLNDEFMVVYGDIFFDFCVSDFYRFHEEKHAEVSLVIHPNDHPFDSDLVVVDGSCKILKILPSPHSNKIYYSNLVNAAAYIFQKSVFSNYSYNSHDVSDITKDLLPVLIGAGVSVFGYRTIEYLKDMGTPERLGLVAQDIQSGKVFRRSNRNFQKMAILLDRDGVINHDTGHIDNVDDFQLIDGAGEGIRILNQLGVLVIVVTNQPVVARGNLSLEGLQDIHNKMETLLGNQGAFIDDLFFCPHHPDSGFEGEVSALKRNCNCRKPNTGMIDAALKKYMIDPGTSWLVGDRLTDVEAGVRVGLKTILVGAGSIKKIKDSLYTPDFSLTDLFTSAEFIRDLEGGK